MGKQFRGRVVLKAASFRAHAGRITALMGVNGAGKTTLLRMSVGRVRADYGRVLFRGEYLSRPSLPALAQRGVFFGSQASAVTRLFTVRDHLRMMVATFGRSRPEELSEVVEEMRLGEFLDRKPKRISGGERQRTSLAMALLRRPLCLLMDEPFAGVAPRDRPLMAAGLRRLRREGCAVVISGHDVADLLDVADEVVWVAAGTTHSLGAPEDARRHGQFQREYLGVRS
jgi:ABC-type multidrug transport system ATPase subunit